jgi:hypothetical protein
MNRLKMFFLGKRILNPFVTFLACIAILSTSACDGVAPNAKCIIGHYVLNKDEAVHLVLDGHQFYLTAHNENVMGRYEYEDRSGEGDMLGTGNITLHPESGSMSAKNRSMIHQETGKNDDILSFLDSMQIGHVRTWPVYEGAGKTVNIVLDADLDTIALEFSKQGCS